MENVLAARNILGNKSIGGYLYEMLLTCNVMTILMPHANKYQM